MRLLNPLVMFAFVLLFSLPSFGQQMSPTKKADRQQKPAIAGKWSQPVNGIRMMVKYLQQDTPTDEIHLLVFLQNSSDKPVNLPSLHSASSVVFKKSKAPSTGGNLRIIVEPLEGQRRSVRQLENDKVGMQILTPPIEPGEIRLHAICLQSRDKLMSRMQEENPSAIRTDSVDWPDLQNSHGKWKISLSFRPDEQFPFEKDAGRLYKRSAGKRLQAVAWRPNRFAAD